MDKQSSELENSDEMVLDHDAEVRRSFDPHISSLALRAITNDPANGYSLASTVGFGSELVRLHFDDEEIAFRLEIYRAELVMNPANCTFDPEFERDASISKPVDPADRDNSNLSRKSTRFRLETAELISEITGVKAEVEHSHDRTLQESADAWYQVRFLDDYTVQFSSKGSNPCPLDGLLLDGFIGWRVLPRNGVASGILARVRIREDWIRLVDPIPRGPIGKLSQWLSRVSDSDNQQDSFLRKAFHILITHLVAKGLQDTGESEIATLSADTVIVRPYDEKMSKLPLDSSPHRLDFDGKQIQRFLTARPRDVPALLSEIGVPQHRIDGIGPPLRNDEEEDPKAEFDAAEFTSLLEWYFTNLSVPSDFFADAKLFSEFLASTHISIMGENIGGKLPLPVTTQRELRIVFDLKSLNRLLSSGDLPPEVRETLEGIEAAETDHDVIFTFSNIAKSAHGIEAFIERFPTRSNQFTDFLIKRINALKVNPNGN